MQSALRYRRSCCARAHPSISFLFFPYPMPSTKPLYRQLSADGSWFCQMRRRVVWTNALLEQTVRPTVWGGSAKKTTGILNPHPPLLSPNRVPPSLRFLIPKKLWTSTYSRTHPPICKLVSDLWGSLESWTYCTIVELISNLSGDN